MRRRSREDLEDKRNQYDFLLHDTTEEDLVLAERTMALALGMICHELTYLNDKLDRIFPEEDESNVIDFPAGFSPTNKHAGRD